jgi:aromatic-amino-acid transaminase
MMFTHLEPYAGDPILSLNEAFQGSAHRQGQPVDRHLLRRRRPHPGARLRARRRGADAGGNAPKPYLPMEGSAPMRREVQKLLFGADAAALRAGRIATLQTVGSSGGLKVGADFLKRWLPGSGVWVSDPTWDNHRAMFEGAGIAVQTYPYYDADTGGLRFDAMCETLRALPPKSVVLLHACCHNPTGVDLSPAQWQALVPIAPRTAAAALPGHRLPGLRRRHRGRRLRDPALADAGLSFFVANSFSKSMSVYGERAGALSVVCTSAAEADLVLGQMKATVRRNYSSPPIHAAGIVARVLGDPALRAPGKPTWRRCANASWRCVVACTRCSAARVPGRDFGYFLRQRGMFSYTGLSAAQVDRLREDQGVYLVRSGRMCVAGLNSGNVERTAQAMATVLG